MTVCGTTRVKQLCAQLGLAFQTVDAPTELGTLLDELVQVQAAKASEAARPRSADDRSQSRQVRQRPATEVELATRYLSVASMQMERPLCDTAG